jgi:hypothetical protein
LERLIRRLLAGENVNTEGRETHWPNPIDGVDQADRSGVEIGSEQALATWIRRSPTKREAKSSTLTAGALDENVKEAQPELDNNALRLGDDRPTRDQRQGRGASESAGDQGGGRGGTGGVSMRDRRGQSPKSLQDITKASATLKLDILVIIDVLLARS